MALSTARLKPCPSDLGKANVEGSDSASQKGFSHPPKRSLDGAPDLSDERGLAAPSECGRTTDGTEGCGCSLKARISHPIE